MAPISTAKLREIFQGSEPVVRWIQKGGRRRQKRAKWALSLVFLRQNVFLVIQGVDPRGGLCLLGIPLVIHFR